MAQVKILLERHVDVDGHRYFAGEQMVTEAQAKAIEENARRKSDVSFPDREAEAKAKAAKVGAKPDGR
jgi:hypothetical protein